MCRDPDHRHDFALGSPCQELPPLWASSSKSPVWFSVFSATSYCAGILLSLSRHDGDFPGKFLLNFQSCDDRRNSNSLHAVSCFTCEIYPGRQTKSCHVTCPRATLKTMVHSTLKGWPEWLSAKKAVFLTALSISSCKSRWVSSKGAFKSRICPETDLVLLSAAKKNCWWAVTLHPDSPREALGALVPSWLRL